ncbi:hypothetical protein JTB14_032250 [Gonioctena quinquepunctata]|nr:hypothetical protein JTB14_032250 [Gonioctena quinquepunctata]
MEKGEAAQYKRKSLDEINIDLEEDIIGNDDDSENEIQPIQEELNIVPDFLLPENTKDSSDTVLQLPCKISTTHPKEKQATGKGSKRTLVPWTNKQKETVVSFLQII